MPPRAYDWCGGSSPHHCRKGFTMTCDGRGCRYQKEDDLRGIRYPDSDDQHVKASAFTRLMDQSPTYMLMLIHHILIGQHSALAVLTERILDLDFRNMPHCSEWSSNAGDLRFSMCWVYLRLAIYMSTHQCQLQFRDKISTTLIFDTASRIPAIKSGFLEILSYARKCHESFENPSFHVVVSWCYRTFRILAQAVHVRYTCWRHAVAILK